MRCKHKWAYTRIKGNDVYWCINCGSLKEATFKTERLKCGCTRNVRVYKIRKPKNKVVFPSASHNTTKAEINVV
jgi:hypothetical protein